MLVSTGNVHLQASITMDPPNKRAVATFPAAASTASVAAALAATSASTSAAASAASAALAMAAAHPGDLFPSSGLRRLLGMLSVFVHSLMKETTVKAFTVESYNATKFVVLFGRDSF